MFQKFAEKSKKQIETCQKDIKYLQKQGGKQPVRDKNIPTHSPNLFQKCASAAKGWKHFTPTAQPEKSQMRPTYRQDKGERRNGKR